MVYLRHNLEEAQKILQGAAALFMRIGIKSVSMDDIAREIAVSKKTIYKHFKDKEALVESVLEADIAEDKCMCEKACSLSGNAVQQMIDISRHISTTNKDVNPTVIYDLQKYYPAQWAKMESYRTGFIRSAITDNVERGQKDGLYRTDFNADIIATMYITIISGMMEQLMSKENEYSFQVVHLQMITYHLYGICTPAGLEYLQQHINEITHEE